MLGVEAHEIDSAAGHRLGGEGTAEGAPTANQRLPVGGVSGRPKPVGEEGRDEARHRICASTAPSRFSKKRTLTSESSGAAKWWAAWP